MPRELIVVQVGQCGNQIGSIFWSEALNEHASYNKKGQFDAGTSVLFRNVDTRFSDPKEIPVGDGTAPVKTLRARAVLVDMEEGVVNELMRGPLRDLFDSRQLITDVSGSGNNWAQGYNDYGVRYRDQLLEKVRRPVEHCDSLQSFFFLHSLGGGTGSGTGCYLLQLLEHAYPDVYRFVTAVFPSEDDDVITSPYNSALALRVLKEHASCVLPIANDALIKMTNAMTAKAEVSQQLGRVLPPQSVSPWESVSVRAPGRPGLGRGRKTHKHPFSKMNGIVANLLLDLTSSMRFEGTLNIDLNEITTNLVPYPGLHFLLSSMSPINSHSAPTRGDPKKVDHKAMLPRGFDQLFSDVLSPAHQVINIHPKASTCMATAFIVRGDAAIADVTRNVARVKSHLKMLRWNEDAFKVGICDTPPAGHKYSLLSLSNSCGVRDLLHQIQTRFHKLYDRKAHLHHYTRYMPAGEIHAADEALTSLIAEYTCIEEHQVPPPPKHTINSTSCRPPAAPAASEILRLGAGRIAHFYDHHGGCMGSGAGGGVGDRGNVHWDWLSSVDRSSLLCEARLHELFRARPRPLI
ncbi:unnamed protein product [Vitrella brassicaformis CCMP3155]|uniref:Tubulin/FtsZ GTPase domain-containing protein n=2 Tax=Vitrella brassicaformis TaxID=1169539 RepID=A0A0G4GSH9_VITBC|nr:unnamed protein product [Vitrella brassicaformis CCMP3155]|eukprot:CEM33431.1 unnamed protein product [Vitrella brassicaformis CCMP3155]